MQTYLDHGVTLTAPTEKIWDFMMDVPSVSTCVPGVDSVSQVDADTFAGALKAKVGPIGVRLEGQIMLPSETARRGGGGRSPASRDQRLRKSKSQPSGACVTWRWYRSR